MNSTKTAPVWGSFLLAATFATPALAASPADQAAAEALFAEARKLAEAKDLAHACPKFAESQRLDPTAGGALSAGDCYEKLGKLASAWGAFKEAESIAREAGDTGREGEAGRRAAALATRLSKLAILVPPAVRVPGLEVRRDGVVIGEGQWGSSLPVDTGQHTIEVKAPGRKPWSTWVRIDSDGSAATVEVAPLESTATEKPAEAANFWSTRRTAGVVVGGVGIAGLLAGAIAGGVALSKASSAKEHCQPQGEATACDPTGLSLRSDGRTIANVSNVAFALGGAALLGGVVLFATAPSAAPKPASGFQVRAAPSVSMSGGGLTIEGAW